MAGLPNLTPLAAAAGTFSCLYVYTPELYPTSVRSTGLALCNGFSRLGGFLAPFATVYLVEDGRPHAAEALLGTLCAAAMLCAFLLRVETRGRDLQVAELLPEPAAAAAAASKERGGRGRGGDGADGHGSEGGRVQGARVRRSTDGELELEPTHDEHHHERGDETGPLLPA